MSSVVATGRRMNKREGLMNLDYLKLDYLNPGYVNLNYLKPDYLSLDYLKRGFQPVRNAARLGPDCAVRSGCLVAVCPGRQ
jgi:hypothetical protein